MTNSPNSADYADRLTAVLEHYPHDAYQRLVDVLDRAWASDATLYTMGNGGSHATASHMVADFAMQGWPIHCLGDNTPRLTATANDTDYADIFTEALRPVLKKQDVVIAFSGSGNSPNVVRALRYAHDLCHTVAITGMGGGQLVQYADVALVVPSNDMQVIEDVHLTTVHMLMQLYATPRTR